MFSWELRFEQKQKQKKKTNIKKPQMYESIVTDERVPGSGGKSGQVRAGWHCVHQGKRSHRLPQKNHEVQTEIFPMFTFVKVLDHRGHFIPGSQVAEQLD